MPCFRPRSALDPAASPDPCQLFDELFRPGHFYVGPDLDAVWRNRAEITLPWEVYQGRLLDAAQTRQERSFLAWTLTQQTEQGPADRPLMALLWDAPRQELHVVRSLLCHVWESYDDGGNVIQSREASKWLMELIGTLTPAEFADTEELRDEVICRLWQAVVGTSRLPLTSLEAPLPAFVLGQLAYVYRPGSKDNGPLRHWRELIEQAWSPDLGRREQAKLLESVLRSALPAEISEAAVRLSNTSNDLKELLRSVFNDVSLSPWTGFVDNVLEFVQALMTHGPWSVADEVDFHSWLLRKLSRHLTAYDLVTFHHRGANYPDALLLDAVFKRLLKLADAEPRLFTDDTEEALLRRRALRHGALLRHSYEGHAVPDAPTSPGENARVLPTPFVRVPEDQLLNPLRRGRKLFEGDRLARLWTPSRLELFRQSLEDVCRLSELMELGTAIYIDRPMGFGKLPLEPDQTPLFAHEVCSAALIVRGLDALKAIVDEVGMPLPDHWKLTREASLPQAAEAVPPIVYCAPIRWCAVPGRPVAALADAKRVSDDFVVVRTMPGSLRLLFESFDWGALCKRFAVQSVWQDQQLLCSRLDYGSGAWNCLVLEDDRQNRLSFETDPSRGFRVRAGVELPVAGLRIWFVRDDHGQEHDLRNEELYVLPRW